MSAYRSLGTRSEFSRRLAHEHNARKAEENAQDRATVFLVRALVGSSFASLERFTEVATAVAVDRAGGPLTDEQQLRITRACLHVWSGVSGLTVKATDGVRCRYELNDRGRVASMTLYQSDAR
jgi:hypothetical protein